jgi:hypothetical protein
MFYNSIKLNVYGPGSPDYMAVHRTYPGIEKNVPGYDPPSRGWFASAPEGGIFMNGPYVETFTGRMPNDSISLVLCWRRRPLSFVFLYR